MVKIPQNVSLQRVTWDKILPFKDPAAGTAPELVVPNTAVAKTNVWNANKENNFCYLEVTLSQISFILTVKSNLILQMLLLQGHTV